MRLRLIAKNNTTLRDRPAMFPITRARFIAVVDSTIQIPIALIDLNAIALGTQSIVAGLVPGDGKSGVLPDVVVEVFLCAFCEVLRHWRVRGDEFLEIFIAEDRHLSDCPISL